MNSANILTTLCCAAALFGCRTAITPDGCWDYYNRYYTPAGASTGGSTTVPANIEVVGSSQADSRVAALMKNGLVELGTFEINDRTDITHAQVSALAKKLGATVVVWTTTNQLVNKTKLTNAADAAIAGTDLMQDLTMHQERPDESFAEMTSRCHTIRMLGKAKPTAKK